MSAPKYAKRRDASEKALVRDLRALGVSVVPMHRPYDALLGYKGVTDLCEFKTPSTQYGKQLNENQSEFKEVWQGSEPLIFRTRNDVDMWFKRVNRLRNIQRTSISLDEGTATGNDRPSNRNLSKLGDR